MTETIEQIERVLGLVRRELWIVTAETGGRRGGLVATWVASASIDREHPTVLIGIAPNHFTCELIDGSGRFGLHLLSREQLDLVWNFAIGSGRERDKLAGLETFLAETGSPLLRDCVAWLDCRVFTAERTGDRVFYWADVVAGEVLSQETPLTDADLMELASPEQRRMLRANRDEDVALQRPAQQAWRRELSRREPERDEV